MKWAWRIGIILIVIYVGVTALVYALQRNFLYFPPNIYVSPAGVGVSMHEIRIEGDQGGITAWYAPPAHPEGKVVMVFHGNASAVYSNTDIFSDVLATGYGVFSVGYPGYPGSAGKPTQAHLTSAAIRQYDYLLAQGIAPDNIVFYGTSLGAGVAAQLAAQHEPSLLILDAPFNSALDMGKRQMPFLPVSLLMKDTYRSDVALENLDMPLIWIHGTQDRVIPLSQGQKLYDNYQGPKTAHIIKGGGHTNLWQLGGREITRAALRGEHRD